MRRNRMPVDYDRDDLVIGDQYNDDDSSYSPLLDEGSEEVETSEQGDIEI